MIATTFNGSPAWLLTAGPNFSTLGTLKLHCPVDRTRTLTGREVRRPLGQSLRIGLEWQCLLGTAVARQVRAAAIVVQDEPVLCPAWSFAARGSEFVSGSWYVTGGNTIGWSNDWSSWAINPGSPAAWDWVAPLLVGRLALPRWTSETAETATCELEFEEDSDAGAGILIPTLSLDPLVSPAWSSLRWGPALADGTRPAIFPLRFDWVQSPEDGFSYEVSRQAIQPGARREVTTYFPQSPERVVRGRIALLSRSEVTGMAAWWAAVAGSATSHYVLTGARAAQLAAGAAVGATSLSLVSGSSISGVQFAALSAPGRSPEVVRILSATATTWTLSAPLQSAWGAESEVSVVVLGRHLSDSLTIALDTPQLGSARLEWREVPAEIAPLSDVRGSTLGRVTASRWLYQLDADYSGVILTDRCTSAESSIVAAGHNWTARAVSHDALEQSLSLERDGTSLRMEWWAGSAQQALLPASGCEAKVTLKIFELTPAGAVTQRFAGDLDRATWQGPVLTAKFRGLNGQFERMLPQTLLSPACSARLFDTRCGLVLATWSRAAAVTAYTIGGRSLTVGLDNPGTALAGTDGFAYGYLEYTAAGRPRRVGIASHSAWAGGSMILQLAKVVPSDITVGTTVSLVPGCVGRMEDCQRFGNQARFRGFPLVPASNPSFTPLKKDPASGAKK